MSSTRFPDPPEPTRSTGDPRPITALDDAERELAVLRAVLESITAWEVFDQGSELLLREVARALGQMAGALWLPHGDRLHPRATWSMESVDREAFEHALTALRFADHAWERREPVDRAPSGHSERDGRPHGLAATIAFPCSRGEEVLGVVELYSTAEAQLSSHLMQVLSWAGIAFGAFFARRRAEVGLSPLSPREGEVLKLAGQGLSVRETAEKLTISPATVKTHLEHIYRKLGVRDRTAAVAHGLRAGMIE
jgi:DNA-binding CsgD family transcriptional regulator